MSLYGLNSLTDCNTSDVFEGHDNFMRHCMKVAAEFETWACKNIDFDELSDVWPYLLTDNFLGAAQKVLGDLTGDNLSALLEINEGHFPAIGAAILNMQSKA